VLSDGVLSAGGLGELARSPNILVDVKDRWLHGSISHCSTKAVQSEELASEAEDTLMMRLAICRNYRPAAARQMLAASKTSPALLSFALL
jgi:hypothetical protein